MDKEKRYQQFEEECEEADFTVEEYHGRYGYIGPCVECDDFDEMVDVIRATTGKLLFDTLGRGYVVYPQ